jgi:transcriptional regulator with XRE-family HTH domain
MAGHDMDNTIDTSRAAGMIGDGPNGFALRMQKLVQLFGGPRQIARTCGFSEGVVRSWRDGRSDPSRERCVALARGLGISLAWLVAGDGSMLDTRMDREKPADGGSGISAVDTSRLSEALHALQTSLSATGGSLRLDANADLLAQYYTLLGQPDPAVRAEGVVELHRKLLERVKHAGHDIA